MASVKSNILLNGINTATSILFPVITFPYAARVLLPDGIGIVNFLNSIINYIVLLTSLGIPLYAVREVAKHRDDKVSRDKVTVEILLLSSVLCLLGYIAVWALAEFVPQIHKQASLFYILSLTIIFTTIGVNWFYQGIENFKFITIRAVIIRTVAAAALFIFVKDSSDLLVYGIVTVGSTVGNNIINFVHLHKHVDYGLIKFSELNITRHIKPSLQIFVLNLIISLYIQLNSIMLGFMSGDDEVGFFTAGTKISHIGITIITSLGTVLLPRCSNLVSKGDTSSFASIICKSLNATLALSIPMALGLIVLAVPITLTFCGEDYIDSIPVLYLNAPVVIFISLTNVMGMQILYPMDKTNIVILSVSGGAVSNLLLNFLLIPSYGAVGAAISTLIAEFTVLIIQIVMGHNYFPFSIRSFFTPKYIIASVIMCLIVCLCNLSTDNLIIQLILGIILGSVVYFSLLLLMRDSFTQNLIDSIKSKIHRKI